LPTGEFAVEAPIYCALTRFGVRSKRDLAACYRDYRRVHADAQKDPPPGLLRSAFLLEGPTVWHSLSLWTGEPHFSAAVPSHVDAARGVFARLAMNETGAPELCSMRWRLESVTNNHVWGDLDLRAVRS
jgi:hypothetical protein